MAEPTGSVKVELEIPGNVLKACKMVCDEFNEDFNQLCVSAIRGDIEAQADGNFEEYRKPLEDTPIMMNPKTAVYLNWWYKVYSKKISYPTIGEFLLDCGRKFVYKFIQDPKNLADGESQLLASMLKEAGVEDRSLFAFRIKELLEGEKH